MVWLSLDVAAKLPFSKSEMISDLDRWFERVLAWASQSTVSVPSRLTAEYSYRTAEFIPDSRFLRKWSPRWKGEPAGHCCRLPRLFYGLSPVPAQRCRNSKWLSPGLSAKVRSAGLQHPPTPGQWYRNALVQRLVDRRLTTRPRRRSLSHAVRTRHLTRGTKTRKTLRRRADRREFPSGQSG